MTDTTSGRCSRAMALTAFLVLQLTLGACDSDAERADPDATAAARAVVAYDGTVDAAVRRAADFRRSCADGLELPDAARSRCDRLVVEVTPMLDAVSDTVEELSRDLAAATGGDDTWERCRTAVAAVPGEYAAWADRLTGWARVPDDEVDESYDGIVQQDEAASRGWEIARLRCQDGVTAH